ncbi:MurR/RpiR family transcriptional regulator [Hahella sp. SMD15-11]|uniref:MurR/RpiR family transcriptional regulator n=1 Tax=Thermohahella caldifontis TaxID=3142973 RepID=A0AB39USZ4_9GAMM
MTAQTPPESLDALRDWLRAAHRGDVTAPFGRRSLQALERLLNAPQKVALGSIRDAAQVAGVNASTLTRMARALGYEGFPALQRVFRRELIDSPDYYTRHADTLMSDARRLTHTPFIQRFLEAEMATLAQLLRQLDREAVEAVARRLIRARRVWIQGGRQSRALSHLFLYGLGLLRPDVSELSTADRGIAWGLGQCRKGDVLVVIGFAPYTRSTLVAAQEGRDRGLDILALTDSLTGPLAAHASLCLTVPADSLFFSNSQVAAVAAIQLILAQTAALMGPQARERLEAYEDRVNQLSQWL